MTVSIIIAVKIWQKNLEECVAKCQELDFFDFEILILPDNSFAGTVPIRVIPTGPVSPAHKRDIAMNHARGEILAFLDDDAYPDKDWLKHAVENFKDPEVAAVGGPAVTPDRDNLRQKASGAIYASLLVSGNYRYRYLATKKKEVDDYPSCNFLVRKCIMQQLGGFNTDFWPGEDTKLCLDITKKLKKKIIYDPEVLVYHHRRSIFLEHISQVSSYALHRGYFVKKYPATSAKINYFLPTLFIFGLLAGGAFSLFSFPLRIIYFIGITFYIFLVFIFSISGDLRLMALVFLGIISTHIAYGAYFLKGLLSRKLKEEL